MLKINDLRIGNYLNYRDKSGIYTVSNIGNYFETVNNLGIVSGSDDISDYSGIEITKELLLKFKFTVNETHSTKWINDTNTFIICQEGCAWILCDTDIKIYFQYIHQLQNLYYLASGSELEL